MTNEPLRQLMMFLSSMLWCASYLSGQVVVPPPVPGNLVPIDIAAFKKLPISGVPYFSTLRAFNALGSLTSAPTSSAAEDDVLIPARGRAVETKPSAHPRWTVVSESIVLAPTNLTNDASQDVEPSVITQTIGTTTTTTSTYTKYIGGNTRNFFVTTDGTSPPTGAELLLPRAIDGWAGDAAAYLLTGDPLLSENLYDSGIAPRRIYSTGIANSGVTFTPPSGIGVWYSTDGGRNWSFPRPVISTNTNNIFYDKPSIAVSQYVGTRGEVYVAYTTFFNGGGQEIHVARSQDGGVTFPQDRCVVLDALGNCARENVNMSQILVDAFWGYLYIFWVDFGRGEIRRASSTNFGQAWSAPETVAAGRNLLGGADRLDGNLRAPTVLMARYNSTSRRLDVVWHEREALGVNNTDIFFASKGAGEVWDVRRISGVTLTRDQFMPALDFDPFGGVLVTYYTRRDDPANILYHTDDVYLDGRGNLVRSEEHVSSFASDPRFGPTFPGFIGDYQDVWYNSTLDRYNSVWIARQTTDYDVWLAGIR